MDVRAQLSSKGQLTVPKAVRDALGLNEGDQVVFRVQGRRAMLARTSRLLDLAGTVSVPAEKRGAQTVFALNLDVREPRHIAARMTLAQQCLVDIGAI